MAKSSAEYYSLQRDAFLAIRTTRELGYLLKAEPHQLSLLAHQPHYSSFTVPKRNGGRRDIEAPVAYLKRVQSRLNRFLQSVYYFERTPAAHGFVQQSLQERDCRNIVTNARKHLRRPYLINLDLEDFFHNITFNQVIEIFLEPPFSFRLQVAELLASLTTYQQCLPVGAPTSPVLSNFAAKPLDEGLQSLADNHQWRYTRYVDDLSISSLHSFSSLQLDAIEATVTRLGFLINVDKVVYYGPHEAKMVTGLILDKKKVKLQPGYLEETRHEVTNLAAIVLQQSRQGIIKSNWVDKYKQQVHGRINFIGFVLGRQHKDYINLKSNYYAAVQPPESEFGSVSWRGIHYF